jgi:integrase
MSDLSMESRAQVYLTLRRKLGATLERQGRLLLDFARYADATGHQGPISAGLAVRWARLPEKALPTYWARRLEVVRGFARHESAEDPGTEIPAVGLLGPSCRRVQPHIYSDDEVATLMRAAGALAPVGGLRPRTYTTLFGLLAATGLRVCEALRLARTDVDLRSGVLTVSKTKFHKSRLVPLHRSTARALRDYAAERDRLRPHPQAPAFFISAAGKALRYSTVRDTFSELRRSLSPIRRGGRPAPRIYDLRHTFVCRRLLAWYQEGAEINLKLPVLSTYLGHVGVSQTYWYLTAIPELMAVACARFERYQEGPR